MRAFVVKHDSKKRGPLTDRLPIYRVCPQSFTSKARQAAEAAEGNEVFVLEVRRVSGATRYFLGYKFVARTCEPHPGGGKWHHQFKFKNEAAPAPHTEGVYLESPTEVLDPSLHAWLTGQRFGMAELPGELRTSMNSLLKGPHVKPCTA